MESKIIQIGAEAVILKKGKIIIKRRVPKSYRLSELDGKIRKLRTKSESKLLEKASKIIPVPKILKVNEIKKEIILEFINGKKISKHLDEFNLEKQKEICKSIGISIAKLHDENIIHGDLTTSNIIYVGEKLADKRNREKSLTINLSSGWDGGNKRASASQNFKVFFIDFGLGFISRKIEDKAVDLHLLKEALEAKHFKNWKVLFNSVISGYKFSKNSGKILAQLEKVEQRGRYKEKY